jgi:hypothetical protein
MAGWDGLRSGGDEAADDFEVEEVRRAEGGASRLGDRSELMSMAAAAGGGERGWQLDGWNLSMEMGDEVELTGSAGVVWTVGEFCWGQKVQRGWLAGLR